MASPTTGGPRFAGPDGAEDNYMTGLHENCPPVLRRCLIVSSLQDRCLAIEGVPSSSRAGSRSSVSLIFDCCLWFEGCPRLRCRWSSHRCCRLSRLSHGRCLLSETTWSWAALHQNLTHVGLFQEFGWTPSLDCYHLVWMLERLWISVEAVRKKTNENNQHTKCKHVAIHTSKLERRQTTRIIRT